MNKIKVIDLLNMISKGEEVPQKIKVGNKIYNYETFNIGEGDNYFTAEWRDVKGYRRNYDGIYYYLEIRDYNLGDEVEIIEEEKKIPEKLPIGLKQTTNGIYNTLVKDNDNYELNEKELMICKKIHEIIDYLDYLKSKGE